MPALPQWLRRALPGTPLRTGTRAYDEHIREEITHYNELYEGERGDRERLMEASTGVWDEIHDRSAARVKARTGATMEEHILAQLLQTENARLLSLGCGPGGIELALAREARQAQYLGLDVNAELLSLGRQAAVAEGLPVDFQTADLNTVALDADAYDIVFCHASLHHVLELEHLLQQVHRALRPNGRLIVLDVMTRSGYLMWSETKALARHIFATLPERLRINHTASPDRRPDSELWEQDTRDGGMECIRSEDIVPLLRHHFREEHFVPLHALSRRFFDSMYGPNYDLARPLDAAVLNWIWELDCDALDTHRLKPETFFGVYRRLE